MREVRSLTRMQRSTFSACFLGWTLDAFDFFLLTVCLKAIAADFHVGIKQVAEAIFWDAGDAAGWSIPIWNDGGAFWAAADTDGECSCVFGV